MTPRQRIFLVLVLVAALLTPVVPVTAAPPGHTADRRLVVEVGADPTLAGRGSAVTLAAVLRNDGTSPIRHARLSVEVPSGLSFVSAGEGAARDGATVTASQASLPPGAALSLDVVVRADVPGMHLVVAGGSGDGIEARPASVVVEVTPQECLRFGVYPGNTFTVGKYVGLGGTEGRPRYGDEAMAAMDDLAGGRAFDVHFYASWRDGLPPYTVEAMRAVAARGFRVNLALKYLPPEGRDGDIAGFAAWVAEAVRAHPEITTIQVTNEANSGASTDSDGGSTDPLGALIEGVKAAAAVKAEHQEVGFNWFYRLDPVSDRQFWSTLGERGGEAFRRAVDWAGVDIYAGTYMPPFASLDHEADFRTALEYTRHEMMPLAGLGAAVPLYVQETGYPTLGPLRDEQAQADALAAYVRATEGLNVGLIQWFELADARSTVGDGWGLVRSDYSRKPAYDVMRDAVRSHAPC